MGLTCVVCNQGGVSIEAGSSLCLNHLHKWLLSKECATARRLYGVYSGETKEKRETQTHALMRLFIMQQEEWFARSATELKIL